MGVQKRQRRVAVNLGAAVGELGEAWPLGHQNQRPLVMGLNAAAAGVEDWVYWACAKYRG